MSKIRDWISILWGIRVKKVKSALNGTLEVWYVNRNYSLDAENVNYSFGSLHRLFQQIFLQTGVKEKNPGNVLLLGIGAGSVISILRDELKLTSQITGVEHDPEVIRLGKEYFRLGNYSGMKIFLSDAFDFMEKNMDPYDLIVIDLFHDENVPEKFQTNSFIDFCIHSLAPSGMLIFNFIVKSRKQKKEFEDMTRIFQTKGGKLSIIDIFSTNRVIIFTI
ncbi:MAG: fused MFS/spermidine synthase [Bacteroidota bacterium]|nr:fused MFS/spermidine synthase [Bacteroidota bacterium]